MSSAEKINTQPKTQEILDTDPAVSMDVSLGNSLKANEVINIDYQALRQTLRATGAPADNSQMSLTITAPSKRDGVGGSYTPSSNKTSVGLSRNHKRTQRVLQHELRHYGDFTENPVTKRDLIKNSIGKVGIKAISPLNAVSVGLLTSYVGIAVPQTRDAVASLSSQDTYNSLLNAAEYATFSSAATTMGALALSAVFYYGHKRERTARKAEKLHLPTVTTIDQE